MSYLDWFDGGAATEGWYINEAAFHLDAAYAAGVRVALDMCKLILTIYEPNQGADDDSPLPPQDDDMLGP